MPQEEPFGNLIIRWCIYETVYVVLHGCSIHYCRLPEKQATTPSVSVFWLFARPWNPRSKHGRFDQSQRYSSRERSPCTHLYSPVRVKLFRACAVPVMKP